MANETKGLNLPYHTDGGRHPSGAILSYRFYHQANGSTRIDCINDGYMVFSRAVWTSIRPVAKPKCICASVTSSTEP
jgi:hypothetical protein